MTGRILLTAARDRDIVSTAAYDFLMFSGFYFDRLLPRAKAHAEPALSPTRSTMQMDIEHFVFS